MAALYADEDVPHNVIETLEHLGHSVMTAADAGLANRGVPDIEALTFAIANQRIFLTMNRRDFRRLHRSGISHTGILLCTRSDPDQLPARIHTALEAFPILDGRCINVRADRLEEISRAGSARDTG